MLAQVFSVCAIAVILCVCSASYFFFNFGETKETRHRSIGDVVRGKTIAQAMAFLSARDVQVVRVPEGATYTFPDTAKPFSTVFYGAPEDRVTKFDVV